MTGRPLDPWQSFCLDALFQERADGLWAARTGVLIVPRQNGKGVVDESWELAQLFLNDCDIVLHTAHHNKTAKGSFQKMRTRVLGSPLLKSRLMDDRSHGIRVANGEYGFTFKSGQQLIYGTRTSGAGRGLTLDAIVLDEAQLLTDDEMDALKPTIATARNPQTLLTGSAPKDAAEVLPRLMAQGRANKGNMCYLEWSLDENLRDPDLNDRALWAQANPGYGIRLLDDAILDERVNQSDEGFGRERLGIVSVDGPNLFTAAWAGLEAVVDIAGPPTFALEVAEDRSWSCVAAAGRAADGTMVVDAAEYRPSVDWVVGRLTELARRRRDCSVVVQPTSAAGALIGDLVAARVRVVQAKAVDYAQACGTFYDLVVSGGLRHLGQSHLDVSVAGAHRRPSSEAWVWDRRRSGLDISPLVAATLAVWGASQPPARGGQFMSF